MAQGITVHGTGLVTLRPDTSTVILGVEALDRSARDAQATVSRQMHSLFSALRAQGIADDDLATQGISLDAQYDYSNQTQRLTGYLSSQTVLVRVRELAELGPAIDAAIEAGATRVNGISFSVDDPTAARAQARSLAMADARARAETLAEAAGVRVGRPTSIVEGGPTSAPPVPFPRMAFAEAKADTPIASGTTDITVDLDVTFAIEG